MSLAQVHLQEMTATEYNGPEAYIAACLQRRDLRFFPVGRALSLEAGGSAGITVGLGGGVRDGRDSWLFAS